MLLSERVRANLRINLLLYMGRLRGERERNCGVMTRTMTDGKRDKTNVFGQKFSAFKSSIYDKYGFVNK